MRGLRGCACRLELTRAGSRTGTKPSLELVAIEMTADEDDAAVPGLVGLPWSLEVAFEQHVHRLEHEPAIVARDIDDALATQDVRAARLGELGEPRAHLLRIHSRVRGQRDAVHVVVVPIARCAINAMIVRAMLVVDVAGFAVRRHEESR